jgi:hypothetical protein
MTRFHVAAVALAALAAMGCVSVSPSPSPWAPPPSVLVTTPPPVTPAPTPTPTSTAAPTQKPTPTALPAPLSGAVIISHFNTARTEFESFHETMTTQATGTYAGVDFSGSYNFEGTRSGNDYYGHFLISSPGSRYEYDIVKVEGKTYVKPIDGDWEQVDANDIDEPFNPFLLATNDVTFVESLVEDGRRLYHLRVTTDGRKAIRLLKKQEVEPDPMDVFVDEFGYPVRLLLTYSLNGRLAGKRLVASYDTVFAFSGVGNWVWIAAPI